jgi:hypothetical protein
MQKRLVITAMVLLAFGFFFATLSSAQVPSASPGGALFPTANEVGNLTKKMIEANPQFVKNPDLVYPGDELIVPMGTENRRYKVTKADQGPNCFWRVAYKALTNPAVLEPPKPVSVTPTQSTAPNVGSVIGTMPYRNNDWYFQPPKHANDETSLRMWLVLLALLLGLAVVLGLYGFHFYKRRQLDPDRLPPVVPGGLSKDLLPALAQERHQPSESGYVPRKVTAGYFHRVNGGKLLGIVPDPRNYFVTEMMFGGGVKEQASIVEGETYYRFTDAGGQVRFSRFSCGNWATALVIPAGWEFVEGASYRQTATEQAKETVFQPTFGGVGLEKIEYFLDFGSEEGQENVEFVSGQSDEFIKPAGAETVVPQGDAGDVNVAANTWKPVYVPAGAPIEAIVWSAFESNVDNVIMADRELVREDSGLDGLMNRCFSDFLRLQALNLCRTEKCPACGKQSSADLGLCYHCGHIFSLPVPTPESAPVEPPNKDENLAALALAPAAEMTAVSSSVPRAVVSKITIPGRSGQEAETIVIEQDSGAKPVTRVRITKEGEVVVDFNRE